MRLRSSTQTPLIAEKHPHDLNSALIVKKSFAEFKESVMGKLNKTLEGSERELKTTPTTDNIEVTESTYSATRSTEKIEIRNTTAVSQLSNKIDSDVDIVTHSTTNRSNTRKKWVANKTLRARKIPKIDDPSIEEKLNRLTVPRRTESVTQNQQDRTLRRRISIVRSRELINTNKDALKSDKPVHMSDEEKEMNLEIRGNKSSRIRRPLTVKQVRKNNASKGSRTPLQKSIKRMRLKSSNIKVCLLYTSPSPRDS